jgi:sterol desaturase/sphingolipid hydroxylase (fatty acid hydroxylase superfamily)
MIFSFLKGLFLGGSVCILSFIFDTFISLDSQKMLQKQNPVLYDRNYSSMKINMLIISPMMYTAVDNCMLRHNNIFSLEHYFYLILIQNLLYFFIHKEMHKNSKLKWIHKFHHEFKDLTLPSTGNAVSPYEFILAYTIPFITGAYILKPDEITFLSSIGTISLFNLIIHTPEFEHYSWIPIMVSPNNHITHHKINKKHYAAPIINLDYLSEAAQNIKKIYLEDDYETI